MARAKKRELALSVLGFKARADRASRFWRVTYRVYKAPRDLPNSWTSNCFSLGWGLPALPKDLWFLRLPLQFGNAIYGSPMALIHAVPPTVTGFCPQLLKHFAKMHEASQQMWRQASTTVRIGASSSLPSACSDRAERYLLPCSPTLWECKQGKAES